MDKELPDNVINFTTLSVNRSKKKKCDCYGLGMTWPQYEVDTKNREITCNLCGNIVDPFEAMLNLATRGERLEKEVNSLIDQAHEVQKYKPWLRSIKNIESNCRSGEMIPCCPSCKSGILLEEIAMYINKKMYLECRKFEQKNNKN